MKDRPHFAGVALPAGIIVLTCARNGRRPRSIRGCLRNLQMIHQLDDMLSAARTVRHRLVALSVIPIVECDHAVVFLDHGRDAHREPHALRGVGVAVNEHHPRAAVAHREVVDLDAVRRGEGPGVLRANRRGAQKRGILGPARLTRRQKQGKFTTPRQPTWQISGSDPSRSTLQERDSNATAAKSGCGRRGCSRSACCCATPARPSAINR